MRFILLFLLATEIFANVSLHKFPLVVRKDYDDVVTKASIVAPIYSSIDEVSDPVYRKIFSDTYDLIEVIDRGETVKALPYAFNGSEDLVNAFCQKYKGVIASANVRGLLMLGRVPVVFWSLENGERSLTRYFVYRVSESGSYLWDPSFSDPVISLLASSYQRAIMNGESIDSFDSLDSSLFGRSLNVGQDLRLPFIDWGFYPYSAVLGDNIMPKSCQDSLAAFEYGEGVLRSGAVDQYATLLTEGSSRKYSQWLSGLSDEQKAQYLDDYFEYKKEIKAIVDAAPFVIILYRLIVPEHLDAEQSTRVAYMIKGAQDDISRTNISFEGYLDDFLQEYDPFSGDPIERMAKKFLQN